MLSSNASYYLKPLGTPEPGHHIIHRAEHLPIRGGTCGHGDDFGSSIADVARLFQPMHHRVNPSWCPLVVEGQRAGSRAGCTPAKYPAACGGLPITPASGQGCAGRWDVRGLRGQLTWFDFGQEISKGGHAVWGPVLRRTVRDMI